MRYTLEDLIEVYANYNGMTVEEAKELYKDGRISKRDLLDAYLLDEGIIGFTSSLWSVFEALAAYENSGCEICKGQRSLAIDELRQMDGEPVWVQNIKVGKSFWMLAYKDYVCNRLGYLSYSDYGKVWVAYNQKPEEG